ncbi:MAG TPA: alpha-amylase family glycosyl hydrolase [Verrucomicrobiae bacterium]|nr:alpha-amylase family glycosyl hydrolase [Verrucomicrobiae bacterium]
MLTQDDIIYFIVTDRFANGDHENDFDVDTNSWDEYHGGDFAGIEDRIPYLQSLGVTALWITPVYQQIFPDAHHRDFHGAPYHGYWPYNFEKVDPHLYSPKPGIEEGSKRYLKDLVDQLHAAGIKVILDMVVNHTGYDHPATTNAEWGAIKPHWFNTPRGEQEVGDIGSWLNSLPDLKQDEPEVADYFTRVIADWIEETGVDCIRMDTAKHVESLFWQYYKTTVTSKFPTTTLLGEVLEYDIDKISAYQQHFAFNSLFDFPLQNAIQRIFINGESLQQISSPFSGLNQQGSGILNQDTHYTNHNVLVTLLDNHDLGARFFTRALDKSQGDREWALYTLKLALTFLLTTRGIPQIYYGTELALEGGDYHYNRPDMPWHLLKDGLSPEKDTEAASAHGLVKHLIKLRKESEALRYGEQITLYVGDRQYVYLRKYRDDWAIVVLNLDENDMQFPLTIDIANNPQLPPQLRAMMMAQQYRDALGVFPDGTITDGALHLQMPKRTASILMPC